MVVGACGHEGRGDQCVMQRDCWRCRNTKVGFLRSFSLPKLVVSDQWWAFCPQTGIALSVYRQVTATPRGRMQGAGKSSRCWRLLSARALAGAFASLPPAATLKIQLHAAVSAQLRPCCQRTDCGVTVLKIRIILAIFAVVVRERNKDQRERDGLTGRDREGETREGRESEREKGEGGR